MNKNHRFSIFARLSVLFLALVALAAGAWAARASAPTDPFLPGAWTKSTSNPVLSTTDTDVFAPNVILDGSTYKMWYTIKPKTAGAKMSIVSLTSPDGTTWTGSSAVPALSPGDPGAWDANGVSYPTVTKEDATHYKMWYTGVDVPTTGIGRVGYATSTDGISWTKYASNPVLNVGSAGAWDSIYVGQPSVIKVGANYQMWYRGGNADSGGIGYATSSNGTTWNKSGMAAVLPNLGADWDSTTYHPTVIYDGAVYHMWYSGCEYSGSPCREGYATSPDGAAWTRRQAVLPLGTPGAFDAESADHAAVLRVGSTLKMWYAGYDGAIYRIGYATAPAPAVDISYTWHTFYGSSSINDLAVAVATDAEGNSYTMGSSMLSWNGPAGQLPLHAHNPGSNADVFILKLNSAGEYQWHTFYGGLNTPLTDYNNSTNDAYDIELDPSDNIYVMGTSHNSWGAPLHAHSGLSDGLRGNLFVMKLNNAGTYQWHTFYEQQSSNSTVGGRRLAVDASGNAYVATTVKVPWSDTTLAPLHPYSGIEAGETWNSNMLILKLNAAGAYQWHTFYGTTPSVNFDDYAYDIAVDAGGNAYITGCGTAWGSPLHAHSGADDIIVLKLNTNGAYQWHTYYGSDKVDEANGITLDRNGYIYVSGIGRPFLGPTGQGPLHAFTDDGETGYNDDTFVLKLDPSGGYVWHTWYGSPGQELQYSNKPVTDSKGNVYVIGKDGTERSPFYGASWNGPDGQAPLRSYTPGTNDNYFVLKLTSAGAYQWHMFFVSNSFGFDLAIDPQDNLVMAGKSQVAWNGPAGEPPLQAFKGSAYMIKYSFDLFSVTNLTPGAATAGGGPITLTVTGKKFLNGAVVQWNGVDLATTFVGSSTLTAVVPANKLLNPGVYAVRVVNPTPEAATSNARYILVTPTGAEVTSQGSSTSGTAAGSATATANGITATGLGSGTVVVARYRANPGGAVGFSGNTGAYTDVYIAPGSAFTSLSIVNCALNGGNIAYWWNGSLWQAVSNQAYSRATGCVTITVNATTSPNLANLSGTPFGTGDSNKKVYLPLIVR